MTVVRPIVIACFIASSASALASDKEATLDIPATLAVDPDGKPLETKQIEKLRSGKVLSSLVETPNSPIKVGIALGVVDAPPDKIFRVLRDYEHFPDFMPYMAKTQVDKVDGDRYTVHFWIEPPLGIGARHYQLEMTKIVKPVGNIEVLVSQWRYTGLGNINDTKGHWEIAPLDRGTRSLVRYTVATDPGGSFPKWLKNIIAKSALPKVINAVRTRVAQL